jgi:hypothetical protein
MEERSWFWRKIGWLFVPVGAQAWRLVEWSKLRRFYRWENSLRVRRALVVGWIFLLGFFAWVTLIPARNSALLGLENAVLWMAIVWWGFRAMRIRLAQPTMEDRAAVEYEAEFDALTERQRADLFNQQIRDGFMGSVRHDEREVELRMRSEDAAYRLLRPGLVVVVAGYWAVCLMGPFATEREMLAVTAIAFTWLAASVLVLPTMLRMWTQPDEVGEPRVVAMKTEA